nr:PREDICTED: tyrosine-protein phosphatase non-receptor type substrate 1-like isoform X1 [Lepisosteus oculatus]
MRTEQILNWPDGSSVASSILLSMLPCHFLISPSEPVSRKQTCYPKDAMSLAAKTCWLLLCLTLLLRPQGAVMGEHVITQVPSLVHRTEGQSVTLNCTVRNTSAGATRWSRDTGRGRQPFFNTGGGASDPRVAFILENHLTDKSIRIDNLTLGDSGVYYCDKYRPGPSSEIAIPGPGVTLTVTVRLHSPELQGPSAGRVVVPGSISLNCSVIGPQGTVLSWRKNSNRIREKPKGQLGSVFNLDITAEDISNNITCEASHFNTSKEKTIQLRDHIGRAVLGEDLITQVPSLVTGTEGQSVTLNCTVRDTSAGAARWSRDTGRGRQPFFNTGGGASDPRVSFILDNHLADRSIRIDNLTLGDSGVYYCDKYRPGPSSEIAIPGPGMNLTVAAQPDASPSVQAAVRLAVFVLVTLAVLVLCISLYRARGTLPGGRTREGEEKVTEERDTVF